MRQFPIALLVLAFYSASAQAGPLFDQAIGPGTGIRGLNDASRGAVVHDGVVANATDFRTGTANSLTVGDNIFGVVSLTGTSGNLNVIYALTVSSIAPDAQSPGSVIVSFAPTAASSTFSLENLLSPSLQAQAGLTAAQWNSAGFAIVEGGSFNPTATSGAALTDSALTVATTVGNSPTLDVIAGFGGANGTAADSFYQAVVNTAAPATAGVQFGSVFAGISLMVNKTDVILGTLPAGETTNQLTLTSPADVQFAVNAAGVDYEQSNFNQNLSFSDQAIVNTTVLGLVPEPGSVLIWGLLACGFCVLLLRQRKNDVVKT